jgi:hypothetical protein
VFDTEFFAGKKALITGASKRLGRETTLALARAGVHVAVHYNTSAGPARELTQELRAMGVRAEAMQADLDDPTTVEPLFEAAWEVLGGIDFLVSNASIFPSGRLDEMELPELHRNLRVNSWAPFLLTRALWRRLRGTGGRASVVNLLDTRLVGGDLAHAPYHLSKVLLAELTTLMALEFGPELQVNGVAPGAVLPPEELDDTYLQQLAEDLPLKRRGYPKDITDATVYLLGAQFVTGQVLFVDGGRHIRMGGST